MPILVGLVAGGTVPFNKEEYAILGKLGFKLQPVGVKFLPNRPERMTRLKGTMAMCEMLKKALNGEAFYADVDNHACCGGAFTLGEAELPERFINGEFAARLGIYEDIRSAARSYKDLPRIPNGTVNYVVFTPLSKLDFEPDVMVMIADTRQTEILLRAITYRTPQVWTGKTTSILGCSWIFVYPFISGNPNYIPTGLGHGMKRRNLFPEGKQFISLPFDILPSVLRNLREMPLMLPAYREDGMEFVKMLFEELGNE